MTPPFCLDNRYQIERTLGRGGFGETFLAKDTKMPSQPICVVKQLKPLIHQSQVYQLVQDRFQKEAAILEKLGKEHRQIPQLYAYFEQESQFYLVQEYIEGTPLNQLVKTTEGEARQILLDLLPVLTYIHNQGIIHRDIKPDNIILRQSDQKPVLIDFGAVRETMGLDINSRGSTTSSIVIGTPGFMPSEQAAGRPIFSSDLYSLALTIVCLLTGKLPPDLTDPQTSEIVWRTYVPNIDPHFANVLDRALQYLPRDRFKLASEMQQALQTVSPTIPSSPPTVPSIPPSIPSQSPTEVISSPPSRQGAGWQSAVITGGIVGICAVLGFVLVSPPRTPDPPPPTPPETVTNPTPSPETTPNPTPPPETVTTPPTPQVSTFYFLADSAYREQSNMAQRLRELRSAGYNGAGQFWIPDYSNLSGQPYYQVYVAKFEGRDRCVELLRQYGQQQPDAYCALASPNPGDSMNQITAQEVRPNPSARISPDEGVRDHYAQVNRRNYSEGWSRLSSNFRQQHLQNDYSAYTNWWDTVAHVAVERTQVVQNSGDQATVITQLRYDMKNGNTGRDRLRLYLQWDNSRNVWIVRDRDKL
ncbi:serine/threonine-protein kinase [Spirulina subsalsa]|nr:serine/threonine-protein kinase [Spirulina subsalsa]